MPDSILDKLERGWQAVYEEKAEEILQIVSEIEKNENLTAVEKLRCQVLKGIGLCYSGKFNRALKIGKHAEKEGVKLGKPLISIEAIVLIKFIGFFVLGRTHEVFKDIESCEKLLTSAQQSPSSEIERAEAFLNYLKGYFNFWEGEYGHSLEYLQKVLLFFEGSPHKHISMNSLLNIIGSAYTLKGELEQGLKYFMKSLEVSKGTFLCKMVDAGNLYWIGMIYHQQGKLDLAVDYYKKSLKIWEQYNNPVSIGFVGYIYANLIKVFLDKNTHEGAKDYLQKYQLFLEKKNLPHDVPLYNLSKARILRANPRTRDQAEAEKILKELIRGHDALKESGIRGLPPFYSESHFRKTIIELCDLLLSELRISNNLEVLEEIEPLIAKLLVIAEETDSSSVLCETYLLQAKLSLITFDIKKARRFLTQAQQIAERFSLNQLVTRITNEKEDLLKKLDLWEKLKEVDAPMSKRFELARLDEQIEGMVKKRVELTPQVTVEKVAIYKEKRICLVCRGEVLRYSYICECGAIYCENCARALTNLENVCWACDIPIDYLKPVKPFKEKKEKKKKKE